MDYVVQQTSTGLYLKNWNPDAGSEPEFDIIGQGTTEFPTLQEANDAAALIGGGTVGTTKPN